MRKVAITTTMYWAATTISFVEATGLKDVIDSICGWRIISFVCQRRNNRVDATMFQTGEGKVSVKCSYLSYINTSEDVTFEEMESL